MNNKYALKRASNSSMKPATTHIYYSFKITVCCNKVVYKAEYMLGD